LPCSREDLSNFGAVRVDESGRALEFREKPQTAEACAGMEVAPQLRASMGVGEDRPYLASMGIYLFNKSRLIECLANDLIDFGHDVIPAAVDHCRVQTHCFDGYWRDIGTIGAFYEAHMDMVGPNPPLDFYDPDWPFYTHPRFLPGSRLDACRFNQTILAGGAILEGCTIESSVIGVRAVMRNATVKRSLIMGSEDSIEDLPGLPPVGVGEGSLIQDSIIDLNARIGRNVRIVNRDRIQNAEGDGWVIRDGIVVIAKNSVIPDDTVI
jgi:glucose-1-phosphate adenylyltransferase